MNMKTVILSFVAASSMLFQTAVNAGVPGDIIIEEYPIFDAEVIITPADQSPTGKALADLVFYQISCDIMKWDLQKETIQDSNGPFTFLTVVPTFASVQVPGLVIGGCAEVMPLRWVLRVSDDAELDGQYIIVNPNLTLP